MLLSGPRKTLALMILAVGGFPGLAPAQCVIPANIVNSASITAGDLHITMGISRFQCSVGDPVSFYLSVYNSGAMSVVIPNPGQVSAIHQWDVLPDTCASRHNPSRCQIDSPFFWPQGVFFFGAPTSMAPGQCRIYTTNWDGLHWGNPAIPVLPGPYHVLGGFLVGADATTSQGAILQSMTVPLTIDPAGGVAAVPASWSVIKTRFLQ